MTFESVSPVTVSLIVPCYNHAKYIEGCLRSICNETYANIEIVFIDDASKDDSFERASAFLDAHKTRFTAIKKIRHPVNLGITRTFNEGVALATGDYIVLLASDDELLPGGITKRLDYLEQHKDKLAVIGDCEVMDGDGAPVFNSSLTDMFRARKDLLSDPALIDWELIFNWSVVGPSILLRKEVFYHPPAGIGLYDESLFFEDRDFYLRLLAAQALGFIDVKVAKYRKSNAGTSFNSSNDNPMALHWRQSNKKNASRFSGIKRLKLEIIGREQNYRKVFIYRKLNQLLNLCFKFVRFIKSLH